MYQSEPVRIDPTGDSPGSSLDTESVEAEATPRLTFLERLQRRPLCHTTLMFRQSISVAFYCNLLRSVHTVYRRQQGAALPLCGDLAGYRARARETSTRGIPQHGIRFETSVGRFVIRGSTKYAPVRRGAVWILVLAGSRGGSSLSLLMFGLHRDVINQVAIWQARSDLPAGPQRFLIVG